MAKTKTTYLFNCLNCPAYCCSYARIEVKKRDLVRLAKHFEISVEAARKKFLKRGIDDNEWILRHQMDEHYGTVCRFLDTDSRQCTIHSARPQICRDYPGGRRCGYYDFLSFERRALEDPDHVATTQ